MHRWFVIVRGHEYTESADTRARALFEAVRKYKAETGDVERSAVLVLLASCIKVDQGRKRGVRRLEVGIKDLEVK